jgi:hypothetical protein
MLKFLMLKQGFIYIFTYVCIATAVFSKAEKCLKIYLHFHECFLHVVVIEHSDKFNLLLSPEFTRNEQMVLDYNRFGIRGKDM